MSTKNSTLAALNKKLDDGKTPKTLSTKERKAIVEDYYDEVYKTFSVKSCGTVQDVLSSFQAAAKKAEGIAETLFDWSVDVSLERLTVDDATLVVRGYTKKNDADLIAEHAKWRKTELKAAEKSELTDKEAAIKTIAMLKRTYSL